MILSEGVPVIHKHLGGHVIVVVAGLAEFVGSIGGAAALKPAAECIGVVHKGVESRLLELLGLGVVDEGRNDTLNAEVLDRLVFEGAFTADLGAPGSGAAAVQQQPIWVSTGLAFRNAAVIPHRRIDCRGLAHIAEGAVDGAAALSATDVDVEGRVQFVLDDGEVVVGAEHIALESAAVIKAIHLIVGEGNLGAHELVAARNRNLMCGAGCIILHHQAPPVRDGIVVGVGFIVLHPVLDLVGGVELEESCGVVVVVKKLVRHLEEAGYTHHIRLCRRDFQAELTRVGEAEVGLVAALGGDEDDARSSLGSIDGGGRSILQHGDALHVGRIHVIHAAHLHAVHYIKRIGSADGGDTADTDGTCRSTRSRVVAGDHHTGKSSL